MRVGSAKLIVDGTDTALVRKAEIALRPSRVRARLLTQLLQLSGDIYNGALQHRRDAWHITRNAAQPTSISRFDQFISEGAQFVKGGPKAPLAVSGARMTAESRSTGALKQPSWLPVIGEGGQGRP